MQQNTSVEEFIPLVFIAGNSHSGSTLLGYLLASHPDIIYLGELKSRTWLQHERCSCGQSLDQCAFYGMIVDKLNHHKKQSTDLLRKAYSQKWIGPAIDPADSKIHDHLAHFYTLISQQVRLLYPNAKWIVDSSKSVYMLRAWKQVLPDKKLKVLLIRRPMRSAIASFVKRGGSFFKNLARLVVNMKMQIRYLKNTNTPYLTVHYDRFHQHLTDELNQISSFLDLPIPSYYRENHNHHVIAGNQNTRKSFSSSFSGIHADEEWKTILQPWQKWIAGKFN